MTKGLLVSLLRGLAVVPVAVCAAGPGGENADPAEPLGQQVYEAYCANCHGQKNLWLDGYFYICAGAAIRLRYPSRIACP